MNYKKIVINENIESLNGELPIIQDFNTVFNENEAKLELIDNKLLLQLKEIDINKLKSYTSNFKNKTEIFYLLLNILNKVENIKSYGLNNGKRNYVDYNKERKVANRKKKEKNRGLYYYAQDHNF